MPFVDVVNDYRGFAIAVSVFEYEAEKFDDDGFTASWAVTSESGDSTFDRTHTLPSVLKTADEALQIAKADARDYIDSKFSK